MSTRNTRASKRNIPSTRPANQPSIKALLLNNKTKLKIDDPNNSGVKFVIEEPTTKDTDHYLLTELEGIDEEDNEIDFVLTDNFVADDVKPPTECREEIQIDEADIGDDDDDIEVRTQEIVEHICGKCYKSFKTVKAYQRHITFCTFHSKMELRKEEMLKNIAKIEKEAIRMEKKDICFCCGDSYDTCHLGHINCAECSKTFKSQLSLERHLFLIHSETADFPCTICNGKIRTQALLKIHTDQHINRGTPFACRKCGKEFSRQYHLKRHLKFTPCAGDGQVATIRCKVCSKEFYRLDNLRTHLKSHLEKGTPKKSDYACPCCDKCFFSLSSLNIHIRTHTGERPFDCDLCEKNFPSLVALKKHRRYHTGEKPYSCSVCNQNFAVKEVLNRHMKRHTGEKPHGCDECGKRFIQATQLRTHLRTHLRPFGCTDCPEKFKTFKQLERHNKKCQTTKVHAAKEYKCEDCNKVFSTVATFLRHEETLSHLEKSKKHCLECEEEFPNTKALQFHMLKAHETNETECGQCDMVFKEFYLLEQHKRNVHNVEKSPEKLKVKEEANNDVLLGEFVVESFSDEAQINGEQVQGFTIVTQDNELSPEFVKSCKSIDKKQPKNARTGLRKPLMDCLREPSPDKTMEIDAELTEDELKITQNVGKLLDLLVDTETLTKFGWPSSHAEKVLCKVIENCGYDLKKKTFASDYCTRMREFVKLLFTVVIQNDSIKELLNNYQIDEVIAFVLDNDGDDDD